FVPWYKTEHHHVGLGLFTPHDVHYGLAAAKREQRAQVLADAFARHPERFPNGRPQPKAVPTEVWINPPAKPAAIVEAGNTMTAESEAVSSRDPGQLWRPFSTASRPSTRISYPRTAAWPLLSKLT